MSGTGEYTDRNIKTAKKAPATHTVEIKLTVPSVSPQYRRIRSRIARMRHKKLIFGSALIVFMIIITNIALAIAHRPNVDAEQNDTSQNIPNPTGVLEKGTPNFTTILPTGKTIADYGGWTRVSPADKNPVYAYADKIGEIPINVSQQPLPPEFKNETEVQLEQLAIGYKASEKITIGDTTIHIGTSANGPQSIIFARNDLLVLIKSNAKISNDQWTAYISSLQ